MLEGDIFDVNIVIFLDDRNVDFGRGLGGFFSPADLAAGVWP